MDASSWMHRGGMAHPEVMVPRIPHHLVDVEGFGWVHAGRLGVLGGGGAEDVAVEPGAWSQMQRQIELKLD